MEWHLTYPKEHPPTMDEVNAYVHSPLWGDFLTHMTQTLAIQPRMEYSGCGGAPGWNLKFKKGGGNLCTVYPRDGFFICLVCMGAKTATETELLLPTLREYTRELYQSAQPLCGTRWMMISVTDAEILSDALRLIGLKLRIK